MELLCLRMSRQKVQQLLKLLLPWLNETSAKRANSLLFD